MSKVSRQGESVYLLSRYIAQEVGEVAQQQRVLAALLEFNSSTHMDSSQLMAVLVPENLVPSSYTCGIYSTDTHKYKQN